MHTKDSLSKYILVFFIAFAMLTGSSYNTYLSYKRFINPDSETYMNIARFDFNQQSEVRRYRIIVPLLANMLSQPLEKVYYKILKANREEYDWPLLTGFFLTNALLMSLAAVVIYKIMQCQRLSELASITGLAAFLAGGRWSSFITGHPVTDSLTILSIAMIIYGLLKPANLILVAGIIIGLLSKESTALFFPMILLFAPRRAGLASFISMAFAALIYFIIKYSIDHVTGTSSDVSIHAGVTYFLNIKFSLIKLFSMKGVADLFSVYGFFTLFFLSGLFYSSFRILLWKYMDKLFAVFLLTIFVHMILSTELARMFYLGSALFIPFLAKCFELHPATGRLLTR